MSEKFQGNESPDRIHSRLESAYANGILYIEPSATTSERPVIDELTRRMTAAYRQSKNGPAYRGWHTCACGVRSDNCEHILPNSQQTNSLCVHYLSFHRDEIPEKQLEMVRGLDFGEAEPNDKELGNPTQEKPKTFRGD